MGRLIDANVLREEVCSWGMNDYEPSDFTDAIDDAPTVLTIPDNPTNGDVIRALFPNARYLDCDSCMTVTFTVHQENWFSEDWWNAPYKENKDGSNNN